MICWIAIDVASLLRHGVPAREYPLAFDLSPFTFHFLGMGGTECTEAL